VDRTDQAPVGGEVGFQRLGEAGGRDVLQRAKRAEDTGIAHQAIQAAEAIQQDASEAVDGGHVPQVERDQRCVLAGGGPDLVIKRDERLFRTGRGDDVVAGFRQLKRGGAANALGGCP